jgi:erythromycin esterase-like protein
MLRNRLSFLFLLLGTVFCFNLFYHYTNLENEEEKRSQVNSCLHPIENNDFSFLLNELQNKRIVVLGEQLHIDGTTFLAKENIIHYLHEKLDYDVVLYEAGLYDMWQMASNADTLNPGIGLYPFWWNNEETKSLWDYYRNENQRGDSIYLGGFDIQLTGNMADSTRINMLSNYLAGKDINLNDYPNFLHFAEKMKTYMSWWHMFDRQFSTGQKDSIKLEMNDLATKIQNVTNPNLDDKIYYRYISGLQQRFESISNNLDMGNPKRMQVRDSLMADNLIWLADSVYPDKKIIVWTSNIHAIHPKDSFDYLSWKTTGQYLKKHYKDSLYTIVFSSYGRLNSNGRLSNKIGNKSLEYLIHTTEIPYAYIKTHDVNPASFMSKEFVTGINQGINRNANWFSMIDLYIFVDTMKPITPLKE